MWKSKSWQSPPISIRCMMRPWAIWRQERLWSKETRSWVMLRRNSWLRITMRMSERMSVFCWISCLPSHRTFDRSCWLGYYQTYVLELSAQACVIRFMFTGHSDHMHPWFWGCIKYFHRFGGKYRHESLSNIHPRLCCFDQHNCKLYHSGVRVLTAYNTRHSDSHVRRFI